MQKPLTKLIYSNSMHFGTKSTPFFVQDIPRIGSKRDSQHHTKLTRVHSVNYGGQAVCRWRCLSISTNLADDRKASCLLASQVQSKMTVNCCICHWKLALY